MTHSGTDRRRHALWMRAAPAGLLAVGSALIAVALASGSANEPLGGHLDPAPSAVIVPEVASDTAPTAPPTELHERTPPTRGAAGRVLDAAVDPMALPVAIEISRFGLRESLIDLDLDETRHLEVPEDPDVPGWYVRGSRPGEDGPAVIVGHVDSRQGPAAFWRLPELETGDAIVIHREDGTEATFIVDRLGRWPKDDFPTDAAADRVAVAAPGYGPLLPRREHTGLTTPIFERAGDRFVATDSARGPWDPTACHGGAPAALLAAAIDAAPCLVPMQGVRLAYDILRPVPTGRPLDLDVEVARHGKRVQALNATLVDAADGTELVRCRALRIRTGEIDLPEDRPRPGAAPSPGPEQLERFAGLSWFEPEGFWRAMDVRFVSGMLGEPGQGIAWFRVLAPLAEGLELTPLARAAAAGDFGNGIGAPVAMGPYRYVNPDLTIDLHRLPEGEWVALTANSVAQPTGIGLATSVLADRRGVIGSALQSLYVEVGD